MRSFVTAVAATLSLGFTGAVRAESATPLMLSCTGTLTDHLNDKADKMRIGVIVNFQTMQVVGLGHGWEANIDKVDEILVAFLRYSGNDQLKTMTLIDGTIDRITGLLVANVVVSSMQDHKPLINVSYDLLCKPAQRLF
jgi:hypothetical protein